MDLRAYYKKLREAEELLSGEQVVMVSLATAEGGKPGVRTEVSNKVAAKLIVDGRARAASNEEAWMFREELREARERWEREESARRMQVVVVSQSDLRQKDRS